MAISQEVLSNNIWLVDVNGRLDQTQNSELEQLLNDLLTNGRYQLIIDLSQTSYINSGGLRILVTAWRKTKQQEGDLVLCGLNARLQEIFSMVGFDKVFRIFPTRTAAEQYWTTA